MSLIDDHDGVLFDLDGVLYRGQGAVPRAPEAVEELRRRGLACAYVTNNASRSAESVAGHLRDLGIDAQSEEVFGSAPAGVRLMAEHVAPGSRVLVTGSAYLRELVTAAGFTTVDSAAETPDAVIQGFNPDLSWRDLAEAAFAINSGAAWFATNLDLSIPQAGGVAPGNGALVEAVARATKKWPAAAGKPEPVMFTQAAHALGLSRPLVVGDRLDTDILGGNRAEMTTALVLTGIDSRRTAVEAEVAQQPDWVLNTLDDLFSGQHSR